MRILHTIKKLALVAIAIIITDCSQSIANMEQDIFNDENIKLRLDEIKVSPIYQEIQENVNTLNELDRKKSFSKTDVEKISAIYDGYDIKSINTIYFELFENDYHFLNRISLPVYKITQYITKFSNEYCKKYKTLWDAEQVDLQCKDTIKQYFFDSLFKNMSINTESMKSKIKKYNAPKLQEEAKKKEDYTKKRQEHYQEYYFECLGVKNDGDAVSFYGTSELQMFYCECYAQQRIQTDSIHKAQERCKKRVQHIQELDRAMFY